VSCLPVIVVNARRWGRSRDNQRSVEAIERERPLTTRAFNDLFEDRAHGFRSIAMGEGGSMRQRDAAAQLAAFKWRLRLAAVPELTRLVARGRNKQARFLWSAIGSLVDGTRQILLDARERNDCESDALEEVTRRLKRLRVELVEAVKNSDRASPNPERPCGPARRDQGH
jgi:hypothetical protein